MRSLWWTRSSRNCSTTTTRWRSRRCWTMRRSSTSTLTSPTISIIRIETSCWCQSLRWRTWGCRRWLSDKRPSMSIPKCTRYRGWSSSSRAARLAGNPLLLLTINRKCPEGIYWQREKVGLGLGKGDLGQLPNFLKSSLSHSYYNTQGSLKEQSILDSRHIVNPRQCLWDRL